MRTLAFALLLIMWASIAEAGKSAWELMTERPVYAPPPAMPEEARLKHWSGTGIFTLHLWVDGRVRQVNIPRSTGHAILDKAAVEALSKWRYGPNEIGSVAVPITFEKK
jgi:protein TonB